MEPPLLQLVKSTASGTSPHRLDGLILTLLMASNQSPLKILKSNTARARDERWQFRADRLALLSGQCMDSVLTASSLRTPREMIRRLVKRYANSGLIRRLVELYGDSVIEVPAPVLEALPTTVEVSSDEAISLKEALLSAFLWPPSERVSDDLRCQAMFCFGMAWDPLLWDEVRLEFSGLELARQYVRRLFLGEPPVFAYPRFDEEEGGQLSIELAVALTNGFGPRRIRVPATAQNLATTFERVASIGGGLGTPVGARWRVEWLLQGSPRVAELAELAESIARAVVALQRERRRFDDRLAKTCCEVFFGGTPLADVEDILEHLKYESIGGLRVHIAKGREQGLESWFQLMGVAGFDWPWCRRVLDGLESIVMDAGASDSGRTRARELLACIGPALTVGVVTGRPPAAPYDKYRKIWPALVEFVTARKGGRNQPIPDAFLAVGMRPTAFDRLTAIRGGVETVAAEIVRRCLPEEERGKVRSVKEAMKLKPVQ